MCEVMERAVIDTNVLIYDLFEDTAYHEEASNILDSLEVWVIPTIVIHELVWFMRGLGLEIDKCYEYILQYINHEKAVIRPITEHYIRRALDIIFREKLSLSRYNDELVLTIALEEREPIATFDQKLRSQAKRLGIDVIPKQI